MEKKLLKYNFVLLALLFANMASAATFLIGHKGAIEADYFKSNIEVKDLLKNLEIAIVEVENKSDLDYLKLDPKILFVEESINYEGPQKLISKPVFARNKKKAQITSVKPFGISLVKADKVWDELGTKGQGARVLVLDSGIDMNHPAFGGGKIEKARNFLSEDMDDVEDLNGHGTHVAGTIAANGPLLGVAPEVKILMGRVCNGGCPSDAILRGVEWGIVEKVDVINLSLGGGMSSFLAKAVYAKAQMENIVVVAASGNDGQLTDSYPAAYPEVLSVGAVDKNLVIAPFSNWSSTLNVVAPGVDIYSAVPQGTGRKAMAKITSADDSFPLAVNPVVGSGVDTVRGKEIVYAGLGSADELSQLDVEGKIALIKRGELTFKEKVDNAIASGAIGVILFNNIEEAFNATLGEDENSEFAIVMADLKQGENLVAKLAEGPLTADIAVEATDYQNNQGTSMASPHVAGIAALIRAKNPNLTPEQVKNLIKDTAIETTNEMPEKYGRGFVDAFEAVKQASSF